MRQRAATQRHYIFHLLPIPPLLFSIIFAMFLLMKMPRSLIYLMIEQRRRHGLPLTATPRRICRVVLRQRIKGIFLCRHFHY